MGAEHIGAAMTESIFCPCGAEFEFYTCKPESSNGSPGEILPEFDESECNCGRPVPTAADVLAKGSDE
jgi:hypothetical protein